MPKGVIFLSFSFVLFYFILLSFRFVVRQEVTLLLWFSCVRQGQ